MVIFRAGGRRALRDDLELYESRLCEKENRLIPEH
jgi:hypothetical protein